MTTTPFLTLIGGPTVLIEFAGLRFLTDPTFDACGCEYHRNGVTLRKTGTPSCRREDLGGMDAILLSHDQHADNLDDSGRLLLQQAPLTLTTTAGAARLSGTAKGLSPWQSHELSAPDGLSVRITATPARHGPAGIEPITGPVIGFLLEAKGWPSLYITGDTVYYEGVAEVARRFPVPYILAFAGAARVRGPLDLTMSVNDLLDTAQAFPQAQLIPVHTEGWAHFSQGPTEIAQSFTALGLASRLVQLSLGRRCALKTPPAS